MGYPLLIYIVMLSSLRYPCALLALLSIVIPGGRVLTNPSISIRISFFDHRSPINREKETPIAPALKLTETRDRKCMFKYYLKVEL